MNMVLTVLLYFGIIVISCYVVSDIVYAMSWKPGWAKLFSGIATISLCAYSGVGIRGNDVLTVIFMAATLIVTNRCSEAFYLEWHEHWNKSK